jgi:hypothetical protein
MSAVFNDAGFQRLSNFSLDLALDNGAILLIALALTLGFAIGRFRGYRGYRGYRGDRVYGYQNHGEALLSRVLQTNFEPPNYHLMNHVTLPLKDGTTQIDHILVSRFGVFVIEAKHYKGWIFANARDTKWTQVLFNQTFRFQNPVFQNDRHVRAVQNLVEFLPPKAIKSVVVFTGDAEFKAETPQGVFSISELIDYLRQHTVEVMSLNRMQCCVGRLETTRLALSRETDVEHVRSLERRHGKSI